jgi:hypothetical protein
MRAVRMLILTGLLSVGCLGAGGPHSIVVLGNVAWTDTGMDVVQGQEMSFEAEGRISLQKGNPEAECGPDGYDLLTVQQPLLERNLGALIGKVVIAVRVVKDEKTGEEKTEEVFELFFIGAKSRVAMPTKGRLFLGINELIVGDNAGEFTVSIETGPESGAPYF